MIGHSSRVANAGTTSTAYVRQRNRSCCSAVFVVCLRIQDALKCRTTPSTALKLNLLLLAVRCAMQASLSAKASSWTTFIVAHRLSTISNADLIVVLREGLVAEMGSHNELLAAGGLYAELWSKQAHREGDSAQQSDAVSSSSSRPGSTVDLAQLEQQQNGNNGQQPPTAPPSHHRHPH